MSWPAHPPSPAETRERFPAQAEGPPATSQAWFHSHHLCSCQGSALYCSLLFADAFSPGRGQLHWPVSGARLAPSLRLLDGRWAARVWASGVSCKPLATAPGWARAGRSPRTSGVEPSRTEAPWHEDPATHRDNNDSQKEQQQQQQRRRRRRPQQQATMTTNKETKTEETKTRWTKNLGNSFGTDS